MRNPHVRVTSLRQPPSVLSITITMLTSSFEYKSILLPWKMDCNDDFRQVLFPQSLPFSAIYCKTARRDLQEPQNSTAVRSTTRLLVLISNTC
ncbi:hypothetical protein TNCV_143711 [Trichonephila clavipes]|nr:hypothetical protein TNCV_143711 [Trichonephila clavipes]